MPLNSAASHLHVFLERHSACGLGTVKDGVVSSSSSRSSVSESIKDSGRVFGSVGGRISSKIVISGLQSGGWRSAGWCGGATSCGGHCDGVCHLFFGWLSADYDSLLVIQIRGDVGLTIRGGSSSRSLVRLMAPREAARSRASASSGSQS